MSVGILLSWVKHPLKKLIEFISSLCPCQDQLSLGFSSLPVNSIANWTDLEKKFHTYFYTGIGEKKIIDLTTIRQRNNDLGAEFLQRF